jgi:hypothetical protein
MAARRWPVAPRGAYPNRGGQETLLQPAALEAGVELRLDVVGQGVACLGAQLTERWIVLLDQLVEQPCLGG